MGLHVKLQIKAEVHFIDALIYSNIIKMVMEEVNLLQ